MLYLLWLRGRAIKLAGIQNHVSAIRLNGLCSKRTSRKVLFIKGKFNNSIELIRKNKAIALFPACVATLIYLVMLYSGSNLYLTVLDEKIRQYFWVFSTIEEKKIPLPISILDLYTSETYNASPDKYAERYAAYNLEASLDVYCKLGSETLVFDLFLDSSTWIGKYLETNETALKQLQHSMSCFKKVLIPVRGDNNSLIAPIDGVSKMGNVTYVHAGTVGSVVYPVSKSLSFVKGDLVVPYVAYELAGLKTAIKEYDHLPIQLGYTPNRFTRMSYEDAEIFHSLSPVYSSPELKKFYKQYFSHTNKEYLTPKAVIVGFSHDAYDQHDVAFNKLGPIELPRIQSKDKPELNTFSGKVKVINYGVEPNATLTPGVYLIASTSNMLLEKGVPSVISGNSVVFLLVVLLSGVALCLWANRLHSAFGLALSFLSIGGGYILFSFFVFSVAQIYLPLTVTILSLLALYLFCDYSFNKGLISRLIGLKRTTAYKLKRNDSSLAQAPLVILQAQSLCDSQSDSYKKLVAQIDLLSFFIQYLGLVSLAENFEKSVATGPIQKKEWKRWVRPTLGNYLMGFKRIAGQYKNISEASEKTRFPEFYSLLSESKNGPFEQTLHKCLDVRNEWKHFASSGHSDITIGQSLDEVETIYQDLISYLDPLLKFILIKPMLYKGTEDNKKLWSCLVYSGTNTYLDEFATTDELEPQKLYLFDSSKWGEYSNTLCLHPWIVADECGHHHREELFFYTGLKRHPEKHHMTNIINYMGITESCEPRGEIAIDDKIYNLICHYK